MVGIGYGYWGFAHQSMSIESSLLACGLCAVSGMLPDLDSDSGIPLRETSMFAAAVVPMLMIDRFRDLGLSHEAMALAAMLIYVAIRFVAVEFFKRFTVSSRDVAQSSGGRVGWALRLPGDAVSQ